ncbi:rod shape-determining protein MreD [Marixanthomonas sp. SCSIO 43207]|uniref:rod shape-determining protein MreD n=1 Tax=Marixanthomonas sp. SCSIO 43207 TaxID=2779360 RepID=UPI001CAA014C|nr:rod shape-determining protein MreD [Marixanthomonas sp. SCSIO 43207]UAB81614.1 rod shape-determining protein MreD [Marixanthomonas sp. SCSIO 43207]
MQNNAILINVVRFILLILIQVLLLNHINFLGYINPYVYILFILLFPLNGNKGLLIFLSFVLGLTVDIFGDSGGVHAAASVFIAYIRPWILKFSFGISYEHNNIKINKTSLAQRFTYVSVMVLLHHIILFWLEVFSVSHILLILKSTLFSGIFSIILLMSFLTLFSRKN